MRIMKSTIRIIIRRIRALKCFLHDRRSIRLETTHNRTVKWNFVIDFWRSRFIAAYLSHANQKAKLQSSCASPEKSWVAVVYIFSPISGEHQVFRCSPLAPPCRVRICHVTRHEAGKKGGLYVREWQATPVLSGDIDPSLRVSLIYMIRKRLLTKNSFGEFYSLMLSTHWRIL